MKIMVCFDGSTVAHHALQVAIKRAKALGANLYLVRSMSNGRELTTADFDKAEKLLKKAKSNVAEKNIICETLLSVKQMTAGENLVRIANERKMDEIYIGIKKQSKVGKLLFGSTAQYVILHAPCPVVSIK